MQPGEEELRELRQLEERLWQSEWRYSKAFLDEVLAPDFFEFGASGRAYTRAETLAAPPQEIDAVLPLIDFEARWLAPDLAQVTYESIDHAQGSERRALRSSMWSRMEESWRLRFHQGTLIPEPDMHET